MIIVARWKPSESPGVVRQELKWYINEEVFSSVTLNPITNSRHWLADNVRPPLPGETIGVSITVFDATGRSSETMRASFEVPLDPLKPVTDLRIEALPDAA